MLNYNWNIMKKTSTIYHLPSTNSAFTIVELLVVIVVIGILAAITIVSYTGISQKAVVSSLQSDLGSAKKQLSLYYTDHSSYPTSIDATTNCPKDSGGTPDTNYCLKPSSGNAYTYLPNNTTNATDYSLYASNSSNSSLYYRISTTTALSSALTIATPCPYGFIVVPGSSTYGTSDFCVMKYNAKADNGSGVGDTSQTTGSNTWPANTYPISASRKLVSTPQGYPVANISQTTAITIASTYTNNCTGCHLITEAEFLTIAQNVLNNPVNWSGGTVGSGFIYSGHNDNVPATALEASTDDSNGYYGTVNVSPSNQRRTLTLSNGEVIWDLAGNVWQWTSGTSTTGQPGITGEIAYAWKQYTAVTATGTLSPNVFPSGTSISGANTWTSTNGIGQLYSNAGETGLRGFIRGGNWSNGSYAGVLALYLYNAPGGTGASVGFRVARP